MGDAGQKTLDVLLGTFDALKKERLKSPSSVLELAAKVGGLAVAWLHQECVLLPLTWKGGGSKTYSVYSPKPGPIPFSRPTNDALFIRDADQFSDSFANVASAILERNKSSLAQIGRREIDSTFYTAVVGYAACMDLAGFGGAGTYFESVVRPAIRALTGREESGAIRLPVAGQPDEVIPIDLCFPPKQDELGPSLVVASKISTRERISQAFVHQLFLDRLKAGGYRSIMTICNENNVMAPPRSTKSGRVPDLCWATDTLVPGTIAKYQRYVATMSGLYYLDPPTAYIEGKHPGLPKIRRFSDLLCGDLGSLLAVDPE